MFGTYRTLLALMVVGLHLGGLRGLGAYAVFGFYILSGYLMTLVMNENYGYSLSGISRYALNRFLRIYPIYWVSVALSAVLILYVGEEFSAGYHKSLYLPGNPAEVLKNIFIFFPYQDSPRLTPPAWALTVELFYYILIGLGISRYKTGVLAWVALSVAYHAFALYSDLGWEYRYFIIPAASLPFSSGAFIYHYKNEISAFLGGFISPGGRGREYIPASLFCLMLFNWLAGFLSGDIRGIFFYNNFLVCSLMVAVLAGQKFHPYISGRVDKWLGDLSYPVYLIHYQAGLVMIILSGMLGFALKRHDLMLLFVSVPLIFLMAYLFAVAVEKPVEIIRLRVKKTRSRSAVSVTAAQPSDV